MHRSQLQMTHLHEKATFMLQSPQNVTKATIGYIIWVRGMLIIMHCTKYTLKMLQSPPSCYKGHFSMQMTHLCYKVHKMLQRPQ